MADYTVWPPEGTIADNSVPGLGPVLKQWLKYSRDSYTNDVRPKRWGTEMSNVGHFAAAVLCRGGMALQELSVRRGDSGGALDLWFVLDGVTYIVEAKNHSLERKVETDVNRVVRELDRLLEEAATEVRAVVLEPAPTKRLSMVFVPRYPWDSQGAEVNFIRQAFMEAVQGVRADFRAWWTIGEGLGVDIGGGWRQMSLALVGRVLAEGVEVTRSLPISRPA